MLLIARVLLLASCLSVAALGALQESDQAFDQAYARGFEALGAGRLDEGLECFRTCLELKPSAPLPAYGRACVHALQGENETALLWLERALLDFQWPANEGNLVHLQADTYLDGLRSDPRFESVVARFRARVELEAPPAVPDIYIDWVGGHAQGVRDAAFSPDGKRIVTASRDHSARVWSALSGEPLLVLNGHTNTVTTAAFSRDGERLLTGSIDGHLRLWDARIGQPLTSWQGPSGGLRACVFSPDEQWILDAGLGSAALYDASSGQLVHRFDGHGDQLNDAAYCPDGVHVATACRDQLARIWDARTGALVHVLAGHRGFVWGVAFSPDGKRLLSTGADGTARLWSVASGACELKIEGPLELRKGGFSPDGRRVVGGLLDGRAQVWDAHTGELVLELSGHAGVVNSAAFSADGARIVTAGEDGAARVWNATTGELELALAGWPTGRHTLAFSPDGERIVTLDGSGAREWDCKTLGEVVARGKAPEAYGATVGGGAQAFRGRSRNPGSYTWDPAAMRAPIALEGLTTEPVAICVSPDGTRLYTVGRDHSAALWDADSGQRIADLGPLAADFFLTVNTDRGTSAAFSQDGARLVTAQHAGGMARIWDARTGRELFVLDAENAFSVCAAFDPTGERVLTSGRNNSISIWDAGTGERLVRLVGHTNLPLQAVFSADGAHIASAATDNTVRVWKASTGECLQILKDVASTVRSVAFSPDGKQLAAAHRDHRVSVWDLGRGTLLGLVVPGERGEWLAFTSSLHYHGTRQAIARARLVIGGVSFPLACFAALLESSAAVRASLAGKESERARVPLPPTLLISAPADQVAVTSDPEVRIQAQAVDALVGIESIEVTQDGERIAPEKTAGSLVFENERRLARLDVRLSIPAGRTETTLVLRAVSTRGILSRQESRTVRYERPKRELYLLALGVADYDDDTLDLRYPIRDVDDLIVSLQAQAGELYQRVHVERRTDRDVTSAEVLRLRDEFLLRAKPDDTLVVFVAGHGARSATNEYWFLTSPATPRSPYAGINRATLESLVTWGELHASRRVLLIDTCHSGTAFAGARGVGVVSPFKQEEVDAALDRSSGLYILAATSDDAFAREQEGNGIFTRAILDGLAGAADQGSFGDEDGYVGASELMQFARYAVLEKSAGRQVPTFPRIEGGEDFPLTRARLPEKPRR